MRVLLMGGTGAIGTSLVPALASQGHAVFVTSRQTGRVFPHGVCCLRGNAKDGTFLQEVLEQGFDVVVDFMLYSVEEFRQRVQLLLSSTAHYVFLSSARVYAASSTPITSSSPRLLDTSEDSQYLRDGEYSLSKARQEDMLLSSGRNNWTILRPYKTYNVNRLQLGIFEQDQWAHRAIRGKAIAFPREMFNKATSMTAAEDVASIIAKIVDIGRTGRIVTIANPECIRWSDVISFYSDTLMSSVGMKMRVVPIDDMSVLFEMYDNRYRYQYDGLLDRRFSDAQVQEMFDQRFSWIGARHGLARCLRAFVEENDGIVQDWKAEGYFDRMTNEREPIAEIPGAQERAKYALFRYCPDWTLKLLLRAAKMRKPRFH